MAAKMLKRSKATTNVVHMAVCSQGDFSSAPSGNILTAQKDGLAHQKVSGFGHKIHIITTVNTTQEFISDIN